MLVPNSIPNIEPTIRVGIIIPEDKFNEIYVTVPKQPDYVLVDKENKTHILKAGDEIKFLQADNDITVFINGEKINQLPFWKIVPNDDIEMANKAGLQISGVVSGRSFHWKKNIDVYLSGDIEISVIDGNLSLINELPIEEYLMCVATSEMGRECPRELIESQTIAARSWMLANVEQKHVPQGFDVCNDDCCQRYQGTTHLSAQSIKGADATRGQVLLYDNKICDARYSKSCGGVMETFENLWEDTPMDYMQPIPDAKNFTNENLPLDSEEKVENWLKSVPDTFCSPHAIPEDELKKYLGSVDEEGSYFRWEFIYTQAELTALLNQKRSIKADHILDIVPVKRGESGRLIEVKVVYISKGETKEHIIKDQYYIREAFHDSFLYSSAFIVEKHGDVLPTEFKLIGGGWGHGAGYCQIGAVGMALKGYATDEILYHYFPGSKLKQIYK